MRPAVLAGPVRRGEQREGERTVTTTFTFMTYEQWREANRDIEEVSEDCEDCGGTGEHECECGDTHDCGNCDGTGQVIELTLREMYAAQLKLDQRRVEKYTKATQPEQPHEET
jgi:DnaJ-class molecular chaperone